MSKANRSHYNLFSNICLPCDLKRLSMNQLGILANEIRSFLVTTLNISGGHFASNLGAVELSIALHYVYSAPYDNIIWDVGHQAYVHKILTGRADRLNSIKKHGGIAGFPKRSESDYDAFGVGHSSTSVSAALGIAEAVKLDRLKAKTVAIIGDGALTAGMAFEALNHAGGLNAEILVVLNDNEMSISKNVGALTKHLQQLINIKKSPENFKIEEKLYSQANSILPINLFETLGFYYVGPVDGHDIIELIAAVERLRNHQGPKFLHVLTKKGKGYQKAENNPIKFHHVNPKFDSSNNTDKSSEPTYSNIFGRWICDMAKTDDRLIAITPAMCEGSNLVEFSQMYPNRYYDVAIAEQHAVTFAAGLACKGFKPVVAIYSTFLQRAYDQVIHDVSIQNLNVLYAVDRAGIVGADGSTHSGSFDLSFMRCLPNTVIMTPSNENECYHMLSLGFSHTGPAMVRYPRGPGPGIKVIENFIIALGQGHIIKKGLTWAILNFGTLLDRANEAALELNATLVDMRFVKPLDQRLLTDIASTHKYIITLEENAILGGAGSAVNEYLLQKDLLQGVKIRNLGLPDFYQLHGDKKRLLAEIGLLSEGIVTVAKSMQKSRT